MRHTPGHRFMLEGTNRDACQVIELYRRLVVLKLWQARDTFDPAALAAKFEDSTAFDWDGLRQLVRRTQEIDPARTAGSCRTGFGFLAELDAAETTLAADPYRRDSALWEQLRNDLPT